MTPMMTAIPRNQARVGWNHSGFFSMDSCHRRHCANDCANDLRRWREVVGIELVRDRGRAPRN